MISKSSSTNPVVRKRLNMGVAVVIIFLALILVLNTTHAIHIFGKTHSTIPSSKPISQSTNNPIAAPETTGSSSQAADSSTSSITPTTKPAPAATQQSESTSLTAPFGTFVSNHSPASNGSTEQSICNSTAGATCTINFTQGSTVKSLAPQVADASGSTTWIWNITDGGLTKGIWKITATATLNGQSKTTADPVDLEVQ